MKLSSALLLLACAATSAAADFTTYINQDGTVNSMTNPAKIGSVVSVWATGIGRTPGADGQMQTAAQNLCASNYGTLPRCVILDGNDGEYLFPS